MIFNINIGFLSLVSIALLFYAGALPLE